MADLEQRLERIEAVIGSNPERLVSQTQCFELIFSDQMKLSKEISEDSVAF